MANSINTNIAAYYAQANIGKASSSASSSIARLSSGNRIVRSADDVAALSAGTSLRTNVTTLKTALLNTSQGASLLQVADGALGQVTDILQRQKAIAVQAGSGSLTSAERSFLNQEFQALKDEIDRLSTNTNFNGVTLLDGSLSEKVGVTSKTTTSAQANASLTANINAADGQTLILNGVTITIDDTPTATQVQRAGTITGTLDNLVTFLNSSTDTALNQAVYSRQGSTLVITQRSGGEPGEAFRISSAGTWTATANAVVISGGYREVTNSLALNAAATSLDSTASAAVLVTAAAAAATLTVNGQTVYTFVGANDTLKDVVNGINANTATTGVSAFITGRSGAYTFNLRLNYGTQASPGLAVAGTATPSAFAGAATQTVAGLTGTSNDGGLGYNTVGIGTIGNAVLNDLKQTAATVRVSFPVIADADLLTTTGFDQTTVKTLVVAGTTFNFTTTAEASNADTEIKVGSTLTETLDNAVRTINTYFGTGTSNYGIKQFEAYREGRDIVIRKKTVGDVLDITGATLTTPTVSVTGATVSGDFANGDSNGVTTSGVTNAAFLGKIQGFTATYTGTADRVNLSITVGSKVYTANSIDTTASTNTVVRLFSNDGGGYFDLELKANNGTAVTSAADATTFADRLNVALSSVDFYQKRSISNFNATGSIITDGAVTGSLLGSSLRLQSNNFDNISIDSIRVEAPTGDGVNGKITFTVNGEEYVSSPTVGKKLAANGIYTFTSTTSSNRFFEFRTGGTDIDFSTDAKAAGFEKALTTALGAGPNSASLRFQVGVTTEDTLSVSVGNTTTNRIYDGESLDVLTQDSAAHASDVVDEALKTVTSIRAQVGSLQSRFDFAAANVESSLQNQDAARGQLLDTDVAAEATAFSTAQVKLQAGISVLAQANQLPQALLKLIG